MFETKYFLTCSWKKMQRMSGSDWQYINQPTSIVGCTQSFSQANQTRVLKFVHQIFSNFSCMFLNPNLNYSCSNLLAMRNGSPGTSKKSILLPKIVLTFHYLNKLFKCID